MASGTFDIRKTARTALGKASLSLLFLLPLQETGAQAQEVYRMESAPAAVMLRTNGLYDLALSPNIGLEVQTDLGLAWQLDYVGAWWNSRRGNRYYSNYGLQTEIRYYPESHRKPMPYGGHHIGLYGQMATYDFEFGGKGYMSRDLDKSFGLGVAYGYSLPIGRRWSLDLTGGLGWFRTTYDVYHPDGMGGYEYDETHKRNWFGLTRLEAAFVWHLNTKNDIKRKRR